MKGDGLEDRVQPRGPRGRLANPIASWFVSSKGKEAKRYPYADDTDLCYVRMIEACILTVQHNRFALHQQVLGGTRQDRTAPADQVILAFLLTKAVQEYAKAELSWRQKDVGLWSRTFEKAEELARDLEFKLSDGGKLAGLLKKAARKVRWQWHDQNAVGQAFLLARRRLLRQIRLICEELARLPSHGKKSIIDRLSANILVAFNIREHTRQGVDSLREVVTKDRIRHAASPDCRMGDDIVGSILRGEITHLRKFPPSKLPKPPIIPLLPDQRH